MSLNRDGCVYIDTDEFGTPRIKLTEDDITRVVCQGKVRLLDVAKANFSLARMILRSSTVQLGPLNIEDTVELLELIHTKGSPDDLQAALRLGIGQAAVRSGIDGGGQ